jgi:N-acetylglucosamine malate deacetylase 1
MTSTNNNNNNNNKSQEVNLNQNNIHKKTSEVKKTLKNNPKEDFKKTSNITKEEKHKKNNKSIQKQKKVNSATRIESKSKKTTKIKIEDETDKSILNDKSKAKEDYNNNKEIKVNVNNPSSSQNSNNTTNNDDNSKKKETIESQPSQEKETKSLEYKHEILNEAPADAKTIILFCAHPDDETIGSGGTLAKYVREGKHVITVIFTDGESSHPWKKKYIVTQSRRQEAVRATKILGVHKVIHLKLHDGILIKDIKDPQVEQTIYQILLEYKPEKIFTHSKDDGLYPDHIAVHKVTMNAIERYMEDEKEKPEVYSFNIWTFHFRNTNTPKLFVDITQTFELKKEALRCFKSQYLALLQLWPTIYFKAIINGLRKNVKYAEVFYRLK